MKSLPANGQFQRDATTLAVNDTFIQQDINDGRVRYVHDGSNTTSDSFTFTVKDPAGNETGTETFAITVTAVDDDTPVIGNQSATLDEGATLVLTAAQLSATDTDTDDATLVFTVKSLPANGQLQREATSLGVNDTFTQQDISDGKIRYIHDGSTTISDSFTFTVKDPAGNETGNESFAITVESPADTTAPTITNVRVSGSSWVASFLSAVDATDSIGLSLAGPGQLDNLPWVNLDTITIDFSEDVVVSAGDVSVRGVNVTDYSIGVTPDATASQIVVKLDSGDFDSDKILLSISDAVTDLAGNPLNGDWVDAVSTVSGDSSLGGDFHFRFDILQGDVNNSNGVFGDDITLVNNKRFTFAGAAGFSIFYDVNGSGAVFGDDVTLTNNSRFTFLPGGNPTPPSSPSAPSSGWMDDDGKESTFAEEVDLLFTLLGAESKGLF